MPLLRWCAWQTIIITTNDAHSRTFQIEETEVPHEVNKNNGLSHEGRTRDERVGETDKNKNGVSIPGDPRVSTKS